MAKQLDKKFIGNDQIDGDKLKLLPGQTIRKDDGTGGSVDVLAVIDADIAQVQTNLDAETVARNVATDALQTQINTVQTDLGTEISTRAAAIGQVYTDFNANDALLTTWIDNEVARASGEEAAIRGEFAAADAGLQTQITSNYTTLDDYILTVEDALTQEVSDRQSGDANLQSQIDAISGGGSGSISALQAELDATQAGAGLDASGNYVVNPSAIYIASATSLHSATQTLDSVAYGLDQGLSQEQTDRIAAVTDLQDQINNVLSNVDAGALDSLTEIVSAFQAADASLNGAITALSTGLSADIDAEEAARIAADAALQGEIDAEEIARAAADSTLQTNINSEAATRLAADNALDARVDILESVTWKKQKFAMSNGQISITLAHIPVAGSVSMFVDQVPMHESIDAGVTDDFSISGTSVSFINDFSATGNKKMQTNDTVYVKYQYKA